MYDKQLWRNILVHVLLSVHTYLAALADISIHKSEANVSWANVNWR